MAQQPPAGGAPRLDAGGTGSRRGKAADVASHRVLCGAFMTKDEKAELVKRAKASGNRLSDFVRIVLLSDLKEPAPPAHDPAVIRELAWQISQIGNNLNQLAHVANKGRILPRKAEFEAA